MTGQLLPAPPNYFLKLAALADRKVVWGSLDSAAGGSWGVGPNITATVAHGLGVSPQAVAGGFDTGVSTADSNDVGLWSWQNTPWDATNFYWRVFTRSGGNCNFPGYTFYYVAII